MKIPAVLGIQPSVALDGYHPDQHAKEQALPQQHAQFSNVEHSDIDEEMVEELPLATDGSLGTRLNVIV